MALVSRGTAAAALALLTTLASCSREAPPEGPEPSARRLESEPLSVLVADFVNATGDPLFDVSLKHGLVVVLGQSPHVRVTSGERVVEALRAMNRSADDRVTADLAWEVATRESIDAVVLGTIARDAAAYVLTLEAIRAGGGGTLARASARAGDRAATLGALNDAALELRRGLGEPEATLAAFSRPLSALTTSSLEALAHYAAGRELSNKGRDAMAVPHYCRAVAADPDFRLAHVALDGTGRGC